MRSSTRRIRPPEVQAAHDFGSKLFEAVFGEDIYVCLQRSLDEIRHRDDTGLRIKLRLQNAPKLADLPWEFLFDPKTDRFLAHSIQTPIVRYLELSEPIRPLAVSPPLNVLVMISSPHDYVCLDTAGEKKALETALEPWCQQGKLVLHWMEKATLHALQHRLRTGRYHIFHFIGHGDFDAQKDQGVLLLENDQGRGWCAEADRIGACLHDHRSLRLAVLNTCLGARNARTDPFAGVAATLIKQGIPAVVAMQFEITDSAAIAFAREFYEAIAEGIPVDGSVAEARKAIYLQGNDIEWGTPVLYMRSPDGILFDVKAPNVSKPEESSNQMLEEKTPLTAEQSQDKPEAVQTVKQSEKGPSKADSIIPALRTIEEPLQISCSEEAPLVLPNAVSCVTFSPDGTLLATGQNIIITELSAIFAASAISAASVISVAALISPIIGLFSTPSQAKHPAAVKAYQSVVQLWNVPYRNLFCTLEGQSGFVNSVVFSPDGALLASGANDHTVRLWNVTSRTLLCTLEGHSGCVKSVAFSPDGALLASGADDHTVRLWRVENWTLLNTLKGHTKEVLSLAFSPDGTLLATAQGGLELGWESVVRLWRVADGVLLQNLEGHKNTLRSVAFSPDGILLASGADDKTVRLWRVADGAHLCTLEGHSDWVRSVAFSSDGAMLASGANDKTVRLWRLKYQRSEDHE